MYISEYTLCGRDFFTALCLEAFSQAVINGMGMPDIKEVYKSQ